MVNPVLPEHVFPLIPGITVSRIELRENTEYMVYECGAVTGNCITAYGPFETYREAFKVLCRFPTVKLDPYLEWKQKNPRHAWALEQADDFEDGVNCIFSGGFPAGLPDIRMGVLLDIADKLEVLSRGEQNK